VGDRPGRDLGRACGLGHEGPAVTVVSSRSVEIWVGAGHARACANPRDEAMARRVSSPGSPPHPPPAPTGGGDLAIGRDREMAPAWHTRQRQRGKYLQINMLRKLRAARPRVRLPPPGRAVRAAASYGTTRRVCAERIDELLRAVARPSTWPARRLRIRRRRTAGPSRRLHFGSSGDTTGIAR